MQMLSWWEGWSWWKYFKVQPGLDITSPDISDLVGGTPLHWACYGNNQVALARYFSVYNCVFSPEDQNLYSCFFMTNDACFHIQCRILSFPLILDTSTPRPSPQSLTQITRLLAHPNCSNDCLEAKDVDGRTPLMVAMQAMSTFTWCQSQISSLKSFKKCSKVNPKMRKWK